MVSGAGLAKTGAKLATSLLTNFGAGFLGSMAEQKINKRRVNPREAIREGLNNSIGGALFGNSPISGLKNAIIRGARSNAAVAAINNIFDSFTPTEQDRIHDFMLNLPPGTTLVLELPGMRDDPRDECGGKNPFHDGVGYALPSGTGKYNSDTNGGRKGFSLVDFLKDVAAGAVLGGLSGAVYYGGGKAVEAVKRSIPKTKENRCEVLRKITNTNGKRNEIPLTKEQYDMLASYAVELGFPQEQIAPYDVDGTYGTGILYGSRLYINNDAFPVKIPTNNPNSLVSGKGSIAHEVVGHYETILKGTAFDYQYYDASGVPKKNLYLLALDEAQASIRAGRFAPGLTKNERLILIRDGIMRLKNQGIKIRDVRNKLDILER